MIHWVLDAVGAVVIALGGHYFGWHNGWRYGYREGWEEYNQEGTRLRDGQKAQDGETK